MLEGVFINKTILSGIHGLLLVMSMFASIFVLSMLGAFRSASKDDSATTTFTVRLNKWFSAFLFLYVFKQRVTVWMVALQIINYASLLGAIVVYKLLDMSSQSIDTFFVRLIGISFFAAFGLFLVDFFITTIKNKNTHI